jgi:hypothetical protein
VTAGRRTRDAHVMRTTTKRPALLRRMAQEMRRLTPEPVESWLPKRVPDRSFVVVLTGCTFDVGDPSRWR